MGSTAEERRSEWAASFQQQYGVTLKAQPGGHGLRVSLQGNEVVIAYENPVQFYRGSGLVKQWLAEKKTQETAEEVPVFEHLTYMADCSRNAVCNVEWLKDLIRKLAVMGYDRLMLYAEDTFEVEGEPFFGYLRGRYSKEELRGLDAYAESFGVEIVPCIQTLAHLNAIFNWDVYDEVHDTDDILCCGEEKTYELIEKMVAQMAGCLHSRAIHIGMDEAEMVGRGRFLERFGYEERTSIMERHLARVLRICQKYGYETCMMWSDMYFKILSGGGYYDEIPEIPKDFAARIPEGVQLIYWDYYSREETVYDRMLRAHRELAESVGFAGGAWKWTGFAPLLHHSMEVSRLALRACETHGIRNVIVTGWGDDGGEASQAVVLPILSEYAEYQYERRTEDDWIAKRLYACAGARLEEFLVLDCLNLTPDNPVPGAVATCTAKYLLYQDILMGIFDRHVQPETYAAHYRMCAKQLDACLKRFSEEGDTAYDYVFRTLKALAEVLEWKADMGVRLKAAYDAKDQEAMRQIAKQCEALEMRTEQFHQVLRVQWQKENKMFGLEVQDLRLGGLKERIRQTANRIDAYLQGEIAGIEELEQERLMLQTDGTLPKEHRWSRIATAGVI